jgi:hypothetical protein
MKKVLLLIASAALFAAAPAEAHNRHHRNHHHYDHEERYFTCHDHLRRNVRHCHGHTNWEHGRRKIRRYYYSPSFIFDF